jgi:hypothetical protein
MREQQMFGPQSEDARLWMHLRSAIDPEQQTQHGLVHRDWTNHLNDRSTNLLLYDARNPTRRMIEPDPPRPAAAPHIRAQDMRAVQQHWGKQMDPPAYKSFGEASERDGRLRNVMAPDRQTNDLLYRLWQYQSAPLNQ